jgi:hypothetical protein
MIFTIKSSSKLYQSFKNNIKLILFQFVLWTEKTINVFVCHHGFCSYGSKYHHNIVLLNALSPIFGIRITLPLVDWMSLLVFMKNEKLDHMSTSLNVCKDWKTRVQLSLKSSCLWITIWPCNPCFIPNLSVVIK